MVKLKYESDNDGDNDKEKVYVQRTTIIVSKFLKIKPRF